MSESLECDVLVVGGGPAGLAAAYQAARRASVVLIDENPKLGGQIWRPKHSEADRFHESLSSGFSAGPIRTLRGSTVIDLSPISASIVGPQSARTIRFGKLILAPGARELLLPFPGWTLPGVFGAGGLQELVKQGIDVRGKRIVVAGSGPLLLAVAKYLDQAGGEVVRIFEQADPLKLRPLALGLWRYPKKVWQAMGFYWTVQRMRPGWWIQRATGTERLEAVEATDGQETTRLDCDFLACGYGLVPNLELAQLAGCRIVDGFVEVDEMQRTSIPHIYCAGEPTGIGGLEKSEIEGTIAGFAASGAEADARNCVAKRRQAVQFMRELDQAFTLRPEVLRLAESGTMVCRCEDVPFSEIQDRASFREAKLHTRLGMGSCQGRICGAACQHLFGWNLPTARTPIVPVQAADLIEE